MSLYFGTTPVDVLTPQHEVLSPRTVTTDTAQTITATKTFTAKQQLTVAAAALSDDNDIPNCQAVSSIVSTAIELSAADFVKQDQLTAYADKEYVADAIAVASKYGYKNLTREDTQLVAFSINRLPTLTAGETYAISSPALLSDAVTEYQWLVDLRHLSASQTAPRIDISPPAGKTFNWLTLNNIDTLENAKQYINMTQIFPSLSADVYDAVVTLKTLEQQ